MGGVKRVDEDVTDCERDDVRVGGPPANSRCWAAAGVGGSNLWKVPHHRVGGGGSTGLRFMTKSIVSWERPISRCSPLLLFFSLKVFCLLFSSVYVDVLL